VIRLRDHQFATEGLPGAEIFAWDITGCGERANWVIAHTSPSLVKSFARDWGKNNTYLLIQ
jgi:hypothetical protein